MAADRTKQASSSAGAGGDTTEAEQSAPSRPARHRSDEAAPDEAAPGSASWRSWSNLWQIPSITISAILIILGIYAARGPNQENDFDGAMDQIDQLVSSGQFEAAAARLRDGIEPNLPLATISQQGRFERTVADMLFLAMAEQHLEDVSTARQIADRYKQADQLGSDLGPKRLERWAESLLMLGDMTAARARLRDLDVLDRASSASSGPASADAHAARNHVFRKLVEFGLRQPDLPYDSLMQTLSEYRQDGRLSIDDQLWAISRQAELRLEAGFAPQAIDMLMVEIRRLDDESSSRASAGFAEMYTLLGRGYYELGDYARAKSNLDRAAGMFEASEPARGDCLVLQGQIAVSQGDLNQAYDVFHLVVRDFVSTRSYLPGVLGEAEVQGMLGEHQASQADYQLLRDLLPKAGPRRDINPARVSQSLCDRHDAALALAKLDRALEYISIAEGLFSPDQVPAEVLYRLASIHRQLADNLLTKAGGAPDEAAVAAPEIDPAVRVQANEHDERAGEYYARHAGAQSPAALGEGDWTASLWLSADSYDRGGRQDLAIEQFRKYLENRNVEDPRRPETLFRIARAYQALLKFDHAVTYYEQVISDHARSSFAAQSYVPLARCYLGMGRRPEAQQQLRQVLAGDRLLKPDARDFRDALVELGRLYYDDKQFLSAIELFSEAVERYPDDPNRMETLFLQADSFRANAMTIATKIKEQPSLPPSELSRLNGIRAEQFRLAQEKFAIVCDLPLEASPAPPMQQDLVRKAQLYRADCAFYLEQYEQAVELYDHAARQYSAHHSSMYALIQIVNCYSALGDSDRAAAAHHRALVRLRQLPDSAFEAGDALMDRTAWERWLDNSPPMAARTVSASSG